MILFHQPKSFYWFSPDPIPINNWEVYIAIVFVFVFVSSMLMNVYVNQRLIGASASLLAWFHWEKKQEMQLGKRKCRSHSWIVKDAIARISHIDVSFVTAATNLIEIGLSQFAEINNGLYNSFPSIYLGARDVKSCKGQLYLDWDVYYDDDPE